LLLDVFDDVVEGPQQVLASLGQCDLVSSAVDLVRGAYDGAKVDKFGDDRIHVASIQIGDAPQIGLARGTGFVQRSKDPVLVSACTGSCESGRQQPMRTSSCLA